MSDADDLIARERLRRDSERSNVLGALRRADDRLTADRERAVRLAADTLLDKALRRVRDGDDDSARRLADRALRLAVDELEPAVDAALAVHLFVWDALRELALQRRGEGWLDRVAAIDLEPVAQREWLEVLRSLGAEDDLPAAVRRRLRGLAGRTGEQIVLASVGHEARVDATLALLHALRDVAA